jgi:serine/threonine protein kinase/Flp pilus assembly protein TadD
MDRERWKTIEPILDRSLELPAEQRAAYLDEACGDDTQLRAEVEALIAADQQAGGPLEEPTEVLGAVFEDSDQKEPVLPGEIGGYSIDGKLGEGGMGVVYKATQQDPRRSVALKVLRAGMDSRIVLARFEAERHALGMMDHPCIAKVFEAGVTGDGLPFFVMEYVDGEPITRYCDRKGLATSARLDLFMSVCDAVQHAHQKGIIHRDLKPTNILVAERDGHAAPKVIDFGISKAIDRDAAVRTAFTEHGQFVGTPEYMSPEQAASPSEDLDTRTDVYSLGVLLYELLTGLLPFKAEALRRAGFDEIRRILRETDPPRPSERLRTLDDDRSGDNVSSHRTHTAALARELRGDLDWIVMRALEKDRDRRYGSAFEFAADIDRHLTDQPVVAGPPSGWYRAGKFARRHRVGVGVGATSVVVLVAFTATMTWQAARIAREREKAERAAIDLEQVVGFQSRMLSEIDAEGMGSRLVEDLNRRVAEAVRAGDLTDAEAATIERSTAEGLSLINATDTALQVIDEEILARSVEAISADFSDRPEIDARLRSTIGYTYLELGRFERAEPQLVRAIEIRKRVLGEEHPLTLLSMNNLAILYRKQDRYQEAERLYGTTLEGRKRALGEGHPDTLRTMNNLAVLYGFQGRYAEAERLYRSSLEVQQRVLGGEHPDTLASMNNLAILYWTQGRYGEAEQLYRTALEVQTRVLGEEHPATLRSAYNLVMLYRKQGRDVDAEPLLITTLETTRRVLGEEHPETLDTIESLASLYVDQGRLEEARPLTERLLAGWRVRAAAGGAAAANIHASLALTCLPVDLRDPDAALTSALAANEQTGYENPAYLDTLALAYHEAGDTPKAIETQERAISLLAENATSRAEFKERLAEFERALAN